MRTSKPARKSRTIVFNGVSAALSLVIALATLFASPQVASLGVSPMVAGWAALALMVANVVNIWLRSVTTQPIRWGK